MKRHGVATLVVAGALALTGCKGGTQAGGGTTTTEALTTTVGGPGVTTTTSVAGPTTTNPGTDPALIAKARTAVLQTADFPTGFTPQPDEPGTGLDIEQVWSELLTCLGVTTPPRPPGYATSATFLRGLATQGRSTVEYTTEAAGSTISTALNGAKAQPCLTQVFTADVARSKPEGATSGPATVTRQDVPAGGQKGLGWRINADLHLDDLVVPLYQDFEVVVDKGTVIRTIFLNPGSEFPQDLEKMLVQKMVSRA